MSIQPLDAARWEMVDAGGRTTQSFGLSRLFGQIYMLLYLQPDPLCLDELAEHLGVSKASISIACRQLASWGAVRCITQKGNRRDYYVAQTDVRKLVHEGLLASLNKKLDSAQRQIERSLQLAQKAGVADERQAFLVRRLREAEQRRARLARLLNNAVLRRLL